MTSISNYRPDIDGLRAIAVLGVVFYHLELLPITGGFVGVDIFFVISGYLITKIIWSEISEGRFTFRRFYERRILRIFPALFVVLAFTLSIASILLLPSDLVQTGWATVSTLTFVSNVLFWRTSDYFSTGSELNPLLHTWSLSVEEQFYIAFPVVLLLVHRFARKNPVAILMVMAVISATACIYLQPTRSLAMFYLSPFRAWELIVGAILAIRPFTRLGSPFARQALGAAGLVGLLFAFTWIEAGRDFPGWRATVPVFATAALIHAGTHGGSFATRLLSMRPVVFIGLISYSLYLWHWPFVVFTRYVLANDMKTVHMFFVLLASLFAATLSYKFVEQPFRRGATKRVGHESAKGAPEFILKRPLLSALIATLLLCASAGTLVGYSGLPSRFSPHVLALDAGRNPQIPFLECITRRDFAAGTPETCGLGVSAATPDVLLWGDSYALAWAPAVNEELRSAGIGGRLAVLSECPPLPGFLGAHPACRNFNAEVRRYLESESDPKFIVMVASWNGYKVFGHDLEETFRVLNAAGKTVLLIGPTPDVPFNVPEVSALAAAHGHSLPAPTKLSAHRERSEPFWRAVAGLPDGSAVIVDPAPLFSLADTCLYEIDGTILYRDGGHLNAAGAEFVRPLIRQFLASVKNSN